MAVLKMVVATTANKLQSAFAAHATGAAQRSCEQTAGFLLIWVFTSEVEILLYPVVAQGGSSGRNQQVLAV